MCHAVADQLQMQPVFAVCMEPLWDQPPLQRLLDVLQQQQLARLCCDALWHAFPYALTDQQMGLDAIV